MKSVVWFSSNPAEMITYGVGRLDVLLHLVVQLRLARGVTDSLYGCGWRLVSAVLPDRGQDLGADPPLESSCFRHFTSHDQTVQTWRVDKYRVSVVVV